MTFSLPTQKRFGDPNIFPKKPGYDYAGRATAAWEQITENRQAVEQTAQRMERLDERITAGEEWLAENQQHEMYLEGYTQLNQLRNDLHALELNHRSLRRVIWWDCCVIYACIQHMSERPLWLIGEITHPDDIWHSVFPGTDPPGSWPEGREEKHLERAITYTGWKLKEDDR